jgi:hypothetical protein
VRDEYTRAIEPARAAETLKLERTLSVLVSQAYALTSAEIALMWQTAPPGIGASILPDLDSLGLSLGIPYEHLLGQGAAASRRDASNVFSGCLAALTFGRKWDRNRDNEVGKRRFIHLRLDGGLQPVLRPAR